MEKIKQAEMMKLISEYRSEAPMTAWLGVETKRNIENIDLFEAIIREAYKDVISVLAGHHIMFTQVGCSVPCEVASADTLMFDHEVAKQIWKEHYKLVLVVLAAEPPASRDALLRKLYSERE